MLLSPRRYYHVHTFYAFLFWSPTPFSYFFSQNVSTLIWNILPWRVLHHRTSFFSDHSLTLLLLLLHIFTSSLLWFLHLIFQNFLFLSVISYLLFFFFFSVTTRCVSKSTQSVVYPRQVVIMIERDKSLSLSILNR